MNKKNIAIAMSGLTVLASAAPVFAATTGTQGYTVVKNDWKKAVKQLQDGLKDNSIGKITVSFNDGVVGEVAPKSANKKADRDAAAEKLYNLVNTQLDKLGDGDYVDFSVDYNLENKIIDLLLLVQVYRNYLKS